ncbi:MAG: ThuA domain-containing protein [Candidatus Nanopelagicaceae bacterium]|jgi:type 1 glutamine amidotransferase
MKKALVVRGGWDGHQPIETTNVFIPFLQANGYVVQVEESPEIYANEEFMAGVDLIQQTNTMNTIKKEEFQGLQNAIIAGTGFAGWHGGIADSYRNTSDYLQMVGGQFANHPGKHPDECIGEQSDNYVPHTINFTELGKSHPITQGMSDFELTTEQYWVLHDSYNNVLATTTQKVRPWDPWDREITSPAIWTRNWGKGKIFVITCGHNLEIVLNPNVKQIIERGLLWASR